VKKVIPERRVILEPTASKAKTDLWDQTALKAYPAMIRLYRDLKVLREIRDLKVSPVRRAIQEVRVFKGRKAHRGQMALKESPEMTQPYRDQRVPREIPVRKVKLEIPD